MDCGLIQQFEKGSQKSLPASLFQREEIEFPPPHHIISVIDK
jgi:hypothetical protein